MASHDPDYQRNRRGTLGIGLRRSVIATLIAINVAVYVADAFTSSPSAGGWLSDALAIHIAPDPRLPQVPQWPETLTHPLMWWQFLTYGFAHSPNMFQHILFNMLGLWFLGTDIEYLYGRREFLWLYLALIVAGGVAWAAVEKLQGAAGSLCYGASGAIAGIVVLYAVNFPRRTILLFFVLPMPAWAFGVLLVGLDMFGAAGLHGDRHVAYVVHLGGAAFAALYHQTGWSFTRLGEMLRSRKPSGARRPGNAPQPAETGSQPFHRCRVCGVTDLSHPDMEFRYCSKCAGGCCYCTEHLRNHEHVMKDEG